MDAPSIASARPAWKDIAYGSVSWTSASLIATEADIMYADQAAGMVSKVFEVTLSISLLSSVGAELTDHLANF